MYKRKKLGIIVNNLFASELSFYITKFAEENKQKLDILLFCENKTQYCFKPCYSTMPCSEIFCYDGPVVATGLSSISKLIKAPTSHEKFYYLNDLDWFRIPPEQKNFELLSDIYRNPNINLICKNNIHKFITENAWNRECNFIADDFNLFSDKKLERLILAQNEYKEFLI